MLRPMTLVDQWSATEEYDRVGLDEKRTSYLDVAIPLVQVPITPGKNITVIAEVIALNYLVKVTGGYSPAERLNQHLIEIMKRKSADVPREADDILYIPDNTGRRATASAIEKIAILSGSVGAAAIYGVIR